MTAANSNKSVNYFSEWEFTPDGNFRNKETNHRMGRKAWEIEMAYQFSDNSDALAQAQALAARAEAMGLKV